MGLQRTQLKKLIHKKDSVTVCLLKFTHYIIYKLLVHCNGMNVGGNIKKSKIFSQHK